MSLADRMLFLSKLFRVPEEIDARPTDIYWCTVSCDGAVEFYSNRPSVTDAIEERLSEAQSGGTLVQRQAGLGGVAAFFGRAVAGISRGAFSSLCSKRNRPPPP